MPALNTFAALSHKNRTLHLVDEKQFPVRATMARRVLLLRSEHVEFRKGWGRIATHDFATYFDTSDARIQQAASKQEQPLFRMVLHKYQRTQLPQLAEQDGAFDVFGVRAYVRYDCVQCDCGEEPHDAPAESVVVVHDVESLDVAAFDEGLIPLRNEQQTIDVVLPNVVVVDSPQPVVCAEHASEVRLAARHENDGAELGATLVQCLNYFGAEQFGGELVGCGEESFDGQSGFVERHVGAAARQTQLLLRSKLPIQRRMRPAQLQ